MAISNSSLEAKILAQLEAQGIVTTGEHAKAALMAAAIAAAVVEEITTNAQVVIASGSSAGTYAVT